MDERIQEGGRKSFRILAVNTYFQLHCSTEIQALSCTCSPILSPYRGWDGVVIIIATLFL